jgi:hypothetical protein
MTRAKHLSVRAGAVLSDRGRSRPPNSGYENEQQAATAVMNLVDRFLADHHDLLVNDRECLGLARPRAPGGLRPVPVGKTRSAVSSDSIPPSDDRP